MPANRHISATHICCRAIIKPRAEDGYGRVRISRISRENGFDKDWKIRMWPPLRPAQQWKRSARAARKGRTPAVIVQRGPSTPSWTSQPRAPAETGRGRLRNDQCCPRYTKGLGVFVGKYVGAGLDLCDQPGNPIVVAVCIAGPKTQKSLHMRGQGIHAAE